MISIQKDAVKSRKLILIALSLSIALNIFAATVLGGAVMGKNVLAAIAMRSQFNNVIKELPSEKQEAFKALFKEHVIPNWAQQKADNKQNTVQLAQDLQNPDLTREVLEKDFAHIREDELQSRAKNQSYYVDFMMSLSPGERKALADGIERVMR